MTPTYSTIAIIVAAGSSSRMKGELPKQYLPLGDKAVLWHTVQVFLRHPQIDAVQVVIGQGHEVWYEQQVSEKRFQVSATLLPPVMGGSTRQASVNNGLNAIAAHQPQRVLIHDAARPFISNTLISRVVAALQHDKAVIPALAVVDTLKRGEAEKVAGTISREGLYAVQTPQGFNYTTISALHQQAKDNAATDDSMLCEQAGIKVALVEGESRNFKITTQEDRERAMQMITYETRTGTGFDVHQFEEGEGVYLCGVNIPHTHKLKGHSDADAGLHALVDALLGAIGEGDIGQHFPPSDPQWKGVDSGVFVEHCVKLIQQKGGYVVNVDITIICEAPKIGKHRDPMRERVASLLTIDPSRVNIKATTTEQLGFTGRKEGIAAQAVANVALPAWRA